MTANTRRQQLLAAHICSFLPCNLCFLKVALNRDFLFFNVYLSPHNKTYFLKFKNAQGYIKCGYQVKPSLTY